MRKEIVAKQVKAMQAAGLDAMISCSPENFAYLTGFVVPSQPLIRHRHAMVIVTADALRAWHAKEAAKIASQEHRINVEGAVFSSEYLFTLTDGKRVLRRVVTEGATFPELELRDLLGRRLDWPEVRTVVGLVATPLAPIAKDLTTSLSAAVRAIGAARR